MRALACKKQFLDIDLLAHAMILKNLKSGATVECRACVNGEAHLSFLHGATFYMVTSTT